MPDIAKICLKGAFFILLFISCNKKSDSYQQQWEVEVPTYPSTITSNHVDNYFGVEVADPYIWMESTESSNVKDWLAIQNDIAKNYLEQLPFRSKLQEQVDIIKNREIIRTPFKWNGKYIYQKKLENESSYSLEIRDSIDGNTTPFVSSESFGGIGENISVGDFKVSPNNDFIACEIPSMNKIFIASLLADNEAADVLEPYFLDDVYLKNFSWSTDGYYYSKYPTKEKAFQQLFYHELGTAVSSDRLIFEDKGNVLTSFRPKVSSDRKFLVVEVSRYDNSNSLYFKAVDDKAFGLSVLLSSEEFEYKIIDVVNGKALVYTNYKAPNYRLIAIDLDKPEPSNWEEVIPTEQRVLHQVYSVGESLLCLYINHEFTHEFELLLPNGEKKSIDIYSNSQVSNVKISSDHNMVYFECQTFKQPPTCFELNIRTGKSDRVAWTPLPTSIISENLSHLITSYNSNGTTIPILIFHNDKTKLKDNVPTIISVSGAFNESKLPTFDVLRQVWVANGGLYVIPLIRGGGEKGSDWHKAGAYLAKKNSINDFISAIDYLIEENYTSPEKIAMISKEAGGLLGGIGTTLYPEKFKAIVVIDPITDMLKYHKYNAGYKWEKEFGSSDNAIEFNYLLSYSPLQSVSTGVKTPALFIESNWLNSSVSPIHAMKFAASLQEKHPLELPIIFKANKGLKDNTTNGIVEKLTFISFYTELRIGDEE